MRKPKSEKIKRPGEEDDGSFEFPTELHLELPTFRQIKENMLPKNRKSSFDNVITKAELSRNRKFS